MQFTMYTLAILLICMLCIGKQVYHGFARGPLRALVSLCVAFFSLVASILISRTLGGLSGKLMMEGVVRELLENNTETLKDISSVCNAISFLIRVVANVLIFVIVFPILRWITEALVALVLKLTLKKTGGMTPAESKQDKLFGSLIGLLCGIVITAGVTAPLVGTLQILGDTVALVEEVDETVIPTDLELSEAYSTDVVGKICDSMGGELVFRHLTVADFDGQQLSAVDEIKTIQQSASSALRIAEGFSAEGSPVLSENIDQVCEGLERSEILKSIALEILPMVSEAWLHGEEFMGVGVPDLNEEFVPVVNTFLVMLSDLNEYNLSSTTRTVLNVVGAIRACEIKADTKTDEIDFSLLLTKLLEAIEGDPNEEALKQGLEEIACKAIADLTKGRLTEVERSTLAKLIASDATELLNTVTDTQSGIKAVNEQLVARFENFGLPADPAACELFACWIVTTAQENHGQISSQDIEAVLNPGGVTR